MTTVATIKGGAVSSLSTTGGLFSFVNDTSKELTKSTEPNQRHPKVDFVNATKDRGERNSVEARRGAY